MIRFYLPVEKGGKAGSMYRNSKKKRMAAAVIVIVLIIAMVVTMVLSAFMV